MAFQSNIVPIPLRGEQCVFIAGIPWDLSRDEAERIAAVIESMGSDEPLKPSRDRRSEDYAKGYRDGVRRGRKLPLPLTAPNERK